MLSVVAPMPTLSVNDGEKKFINIDASKLGGHLSRYDGQTIFLSFEISADGNKMNDDVCLNVEGQETLISDLNSGVSPKYCKSDALTRTNVTILNLASHSQEEVVAVDWCDAASRNETPMILEFEEQPDWSVYVSVKDKEMMQLHLMVSRVQGSLFDGEGAFWLTSSLR